MGATRRADIADPDFARQLQGYSLTTAEILYRLPDHPGLLQTYIWQDYDVHPRFLACRRFCPSGPTTSMAACIAFASPTPA